MKIDLKQNRIETFDIAKGIGILLMVMGHTGYGDIFLKLIYTFHMPLFFFISGYFYRPQKNTDFKLYLVHQVNVLLVPYVVFAIFYEILHYIYTGEVSISYFFTSLISSNHNRIDVAGALWFLLTLFTAKIIYWFLNHHIRDIVNLTIVVAVLSFAALTLRRFDVFLPFAADTALSMLIVIHSGYLLYAYRGRGIIQRLSNLNYMLIFLVVCVFVATALVNDRVLVRRNRYGIEVLYMISCFCGIILTMNISHLLSKAGNRVLKFIKNTLSYWGRESVVFLLINELMIFIVGECMIVLGVSKNLFSGNYWIDTVVVFASMGLMSIMALISRHKPFSFIFGKKKIFK